MRDLCHKSKKKLIRKVRINRNVACIDNLSKQKVSPALALFDRNLTTALENEHGEKERGDCALLKNINGHAVQPLLTVTTSKGLKLKEATIFSSIGDLRLKCFREISALLTDDWFPCVKKFKSIHVFYLIGMHHQTHYQIMLGHLNVN